MGPYCCVYRLIRNSVQILDCLYKFINTFCCVLIFCCYSFSGAIWCVSHITVHWSREFPWMADGNELELFSSQISWKWIRRNSIGVYLFTDLIKVVLTIHSRSKFIKIWYRQACLDNKPALTVHQITNDTDEPTRIWIWILAAWLRQRRRIW